MGMYIGQPSQTQASAQTFPPPQQQQQNQNIQDFQNKLQNNEYELPNPDDVDRWLDDKMR